MWTPDLDMTFVGYNSVARRVPNEQGRMLKTAGVPRPELRGHWDTVICDESHLLTNPKAKWTMAVSKLDRDRLYLATGTPITNWASELLVTLRLLMPGDRRFTNKQNWLKRWFKMKPGFSGRPEVYVPRNDPNHGLLDRWTWSDFWAGNSMDGEHGRMLQRDVDLGVPFTEQTIECPMVPEQAKLYKELKADYLAWLPDGTEVSAWSGGGLHTKLHRVSTGLESLGVGAVGSGKLRVVREQLEANPQSTLLFCQYRATAEALTRLVEDVGLSVGTIHGGVAQPERDRLRVEFQAGRIQVLACTLSTVSMGLAFDRASTEIFVEHSWSPWRNDQALKRAMVQGKTAHVHVLHLWTPKSVDAGMRRDMATKTEHQIKALSAREFRYLLDG